MARRRFIAVALAAVLAATPAAAGDTHLRYEVMWGGLHAADFALSLSDGDATYANRFRLETRGIADWFLRLKVSASSRGMVKPSSRGEAPEAAALTPRTYRVGYTNRRRQRTLSLKFDAETGEVSPIVEFEATIDGEAVPRDDDEAPTVPRELRRHVLDPLTALVESLRRVRRHLAGGRSDFRLRVYDGRRRFDVDGTYGGRVRRTILNVARDLHRVRLKTIPVAGFSRAHRILWDGSSFDLFLGTDGRLVPIQIMSVGPGPVMNLIEECAAGCALPPD